MKEKAMGFTSNLALSLKSRCVACSVLQANLNKLVLEASIEFETRCLCNCTDIQYLLKKKKTNDSCCFVASYF
jgi:hypothetical protein